MTMSTKLDRRMVLRGTLAGGVVSVGLPMLEGFLNTNGTALAATARRRIVGARRITAHTRSSGRSCRSS